VRGQTDNPGMPWRQYSLAYAGFLVGRVLPTLSNVKAKIA